MCLSSAYKNETADANILMKNVMTVECHENTVLLTDLFGEQLEIAGSLKKASLTDGYVIVRAEE